MPYIKQEERERFDFLLDDLSVAIERGCAPGDLNYVITRIVHAYLDARGMHYTHLNDAIGVLECAKQELYRRIAAPYEDRKIHENGDV